MMPTVSLGTIVIVALVILALMIIGWWLSSLARRLDRVHRRAERTWLVLDAALARRARCAHDLVMSPAHPSRDEQGASLGSVCDVAGALEGTGPGKVEGSAREYAESALSRMLTVALIPEDSHLVEAQQRVSVARLLHNDAVTTARTLRRRRSVRLFRLAGHAPALMPFEMVDYPDPEVSTWPRRASAGAASAVPVDELTTTLGPWNRPVG